MIAGVVWVMVVLHRHPCGTVCELDKVVEVWVGPEVQKFLHRRKLTLVSSLRLLVTTLSTSVVPVVDTFAHDLLLAQDKLLDLLVTLLTRLLKFVPLNLLIVRDALVQGLSIPGKLRLVPGFAPPCLRRGTDGLTLLVVDSLARIVQQLMLVVFVAANIAAIQVLLVPLVPFAFRATE